MNNLLIVQARMNSKRLPGKVLHKIKGKAVLEYLIERISQCRLIDKIVVATSIKKNDSEIEDFCHEKKLTCFRGSEENTAFRFHELLKKHYCNYFVRISGDSPLIDPSIIDQGVEIYNNGHYDLVTNIFPRTFPVGQSVEVLNTDIYNKSFFKMNTSDELEHVTKYYYEYSDNFVIGNFKNNYDLSHYRLVIDTKKDFQRIKKIIKKMEKPHKEYNMEKLIQDSLDNISKYTTMVIIAHRLSTIKNCNKIIVLNQGNIIEIGDYDYLMNKKESFYNLVKQQNF